jgi:hypothetical protein
MNGRGVLRREVKRNQGGVGPVEQPGGQAAVLREREPVPDRVLEPDLVGRVLPEIPQQRVLEAARVGAASGKTPQRRLQRQLVARQSPEREWRPVPLQIGIPRARVQVVDDVEPAAGTGAGTGSDSLSRGGIEAMLRPRGQILFLARLSSWVNT